MWENDTLTGARRLCCRTGAARAAAAEAGGARRQYNPLDDGERRHRPDQRGGHRRRSPARRSATPTPTSSCSRPTSTGRMEVVDLLHAVPAEATTRSAAPLIQRRRRGCRQAASAKYQGRTRLRRHRLRRVLHGARQPAAPARRRGQRAGRGAVADLRPGQLSTSSGHSAPSPSRSGRPRPRRSCGVPARRRRGLLGGRAWPGRAPWLAAPAAAPSARPTRRAAHSPRPSSTVPVLRRSTRRASPPRLRTGWPSAP